MSLPLMLPTPNEDRRDFLLRYVRAFPGMTASEIAKKTGVPSGAVRRMMRSLEIRGYVRGELKTVTAPHINKAAMAYYPEDEVR